VACKQDVDCTDLFLDGPCVNGACADIDHCMHDSDCPGSTDVCSCYPQTLVMGGFSYGNACVAGNCRTDADCGPGGFCSPTVDPQCGGYRGVQGYDCHTCEDTCVDDTDCGDGKPGSPYCAYDPTVGHWTCGTGVCAG